MSEHQQKVLPQPSRGAKAGNNSVMCALTLIYHLEYEPAILGIIQREMAVARYTKIPDVIGARTDMLQHTDYAPDGHYQMLMIFAERAVILDLAEEFRKLRHAKCHGIRGFVTPVEEVI